MSRCTFYVRSDAGNIRCSRELHADEIPHKFICELVIPASYKKSGSELRDIVRVMARKRLADTCPSAQSAMDGIRRDFRFAILMSENPEKRKELEKLMTAVQNFSDLEFASRQSLRTAWVEHVSALIRPEKEEGDEV